ncbi:PhzF family phenazine biosynthesis protein [Methylobacterium sp. SyP6R]|uniref:PhzF family phenazine biosynthesis protein n=1 Tax=Methylobacterium sp. SyP6R TaxID=2718876 RepID=UPI001F27F67B|nr:PhzF family phenazine biosynthesis protein [Methylobacterium sp. SyP6R]MCF4130068.1 PhzF family phenazine biosynthesis protein [Methylobacterium sp. SyP6R]
MNFPSTTTRLELWQVDVFAERPLSGNPAAVIFGAADLPDDMLQAIARETNLSETVFLAPPEEGGDFRVRIFTTKRELRFAGHPTLAAAHAFTEATGSTAIGLRQECGIGLVTVQRANPGATWFVQMPEASLTQTDIVPEKVAAALGIALESVLDRPVVRAATGVPWLLVELDGPAALAALTPDFSAITRITRAHDAVGLTVFVRAPCPGVAARLRSFAPAEGIYEDPVCGSCAGALAAFLLSGSPPPPGELVFEQGAEISRPGRVLISAADEGAARRHAVGGRCVTVLRGQLKL